LNTANTFRYHKRCWRLSWTPIQLFN